MSSWTTSNAGGARNPRAPKGLRRRGTVYGVPAPRRWLGIACVAAPCIRPHGARNAAMRTFTTGCKGDHEIWFSPITDRRFVVDSGIKSRHTANGVLKQAGVEERF